MSAKKPIAKLLRLERFLRVVDCWFKTRLSELHLLVKPYKNGGRCPECGRRCKIVRHMPDVRTWRDVRVCGWTVIFIYCPKEIRCPRHGRQQEARNLKYILYSLSEKQIFHSPFTFTT